MRRISHLTDAPILDKARDGLLDGLLGHSVIATLPRGSSASQDTKDLLSIQPPLGLTYQWVRTAMLGEDDRANVEGRLQNGWRFVEVSAHPTIHRVVLRNLLEEPSAMVLMQRPTADVQAQFAHEHAERTKLLEDAKAKLIADGIAVSITNGEKTT